ADASDRSPTRVDGRSDPKPALDRQTRCARSGHEDRNVRGAVVLAVVTSKPAKPPSVSIDLTSKVPLMMNELSCGGRVSVGRLALKRELAAFARVRQNFPLLCRCFTPGVLASQP